MGEVIDFNEYKSLEKEYIEDYLPYLNKKFNFHKVKDTKTMGRSLYMLTRYIEGVINALKILSIIDERAKESLKYLKIWLQGIIEDL